MKKKFQVLESLMMILRQSWDPFMHIGLPTQPQDLSVGWTNMTRDKEKTGESRGGFLVIIIQTNLTHEGGSRGRWKLKIRRLGIRKEKRGMKS